MTHPLSDVPAACPKCHGLSGFFTDIRFTAQRVYNWGGREVDTDRFFVTSERNARCIDCRAPVRKPKGQQ